MKTLGRTVRSTLQEWGAWVTGLIAITWVLLATRLIPVPNADYGMFLTVAERLQAGDRLYVDVFENKEPLVHYSLAMSLWLGPYGPWILAAGLILLGGGAAYSVARYLDLRPRTAALLGFAATPLILTGASYFPGSSHVPGVIVSLWIIAASLRGRWVLAGVLLGLLPFTKLVLVPLAVVAVVVFAWGRRDGRLLWRTALVAAASAAVCMVVLLLRGEGNAFLTALTANVEYSQAAGGGEGQWVAAIRDHIVRVFNADNLVVVWVSVALVAWVSAAITWRRRPAMSPLVLMVLASLAMTAYAVVAVALTGLWGHHGMIFKPVAVLSIILVGATGPDVIRNARPMALPAIAALTYLLTGILAPGDYVGSMLYARANIILQSQQPVEAQWIASTGAPTTYARVGDGDDGGHAMTLGDWTLACPRFGQSIWESRSILMSTLECLPTANVILVTPDVQPNDTYPDWNEFLDGLDALLASDYVCRQVDAEGGRVCRRPGT